MNPNQPIRSPFGDIATFNSPALDRMGAIWYQEEKERKAKALAAEKAEKDDYTEKLTNIRAADVDEYKDLNNKWATARKEAIQLSKKGNPADYQKKIEESNILFAKLNRLVNASLEEKKNPNRQVSIKDRSDDYDEIDAVYKITPTSQLNKTYKTKSGREIVLADVEPLIYRPKLIDFNKSIKNALGKERTGSLEKNDLGNGKIMYRTPMFYNNAAEIADGLVSEMNTVRGGVREVEANLGFLEEQAPKIEAEFETYTNTPEYLKIYGEKPRFSPPKTRAENLIILAAKDAALKHKPRYLDGEEKFSEEQKLKQKKEADAVNFEQQKTLFRMGAAERLAREKRKNAFDIKLKSLGLGKKDAEEFDYVRRLADVANYVEGSGEEIPFDLQGVRSDVYGVAKSDAPLLDVTATFKDVKYSDDNSESTTKDGATKTLKSSKIERVFKNAKNGDLMVKFNNKEDAAKIMGRNVEDLVDPNGYHVLRGKSAKDAFLKAVASSYKFNEEKTRLITSRIDNDQTKPGVQSKAAQQPKTKEAPKAKQVSKQSKKPKAELDDL
jgi:hypothetical protein